MRSFRATLLVSLPLLSLGLAQPVLDDSREAQVPTLRQAIGTLPEESLDAVLRDNLPKYRAGVFPDSQNAVEAVRNDDPELAAKLVGIAKQSVALKENLRIRQANATTDTVTTTASVTVTTGGTTSSTPSVTSTPTSQATTSTPTDTPTSDTSVALGTSTETGVLVPVTSSTTDSVGSVIEQTTSALATSAPTSVVVPVTTTNDQGSVVVSSTVAPAIVVSSTNAAGSVVTSASVLSTVAVAPGGNIVTSAPAQVTTTAANGGTVVLSSPNYDGVYTTTDNIGRTVTVTYKPTNARVSQLTLLTSTMPNGQLATITSYAIVGAQNTGTGKPGPSSTTTGKPHLQTDGSSANGLGADKAFVMAAALGVVGFFA